MNPGFEYLFLALLLIMIGIVLIAGIVFWVFALGGKDLSNQDAQWQRREELNVHPGSVRGLR